MISNDGLIIENMDLSHINLAVFSRLLDGDQEDQLCLFHLLPLFMVILGPQNGWNTICQN
jgi:hypothetical protein